MSINQFEKRYEVVAFGDSFVRVFSLLKPGCVRHFAFKGATIKGLLKPDNPNRKRILAELEARKNKRVVAIFNFGQVDLNFSEYFDALNNKPRDNAAIISDYLKFVLGLTAQYRIVLGVYPCPIREEHIMKVLVKYGVIPEHYDPDCEARVRRLSSWSTAQLRFWEYRRLMRECSERAGVVFVDLAREILDEECRIRPQYIDVSALNIHLLWKPLIFNLVERLGWLGLSPSDIIENLDQNQQDYIDKKVQRLKALNLPH